MNSFESVQKCARLALHRGEAGQRRHMLKIFGGMH